MAADELTIIRIKAFLQLLESTVTAALPLITIASGIQERLQRLYEISKSTDANVSDEFLREYRAIGDASPRIEPANAAFRNALEILEVDPTTDFGLAVSVSATVLANFVVKNAILSDRTPEEVWQEYVLRESDIDGFFS